MSHIKAFLILLYWPPNGVMVQFNIIRCLYVESPAHKHDLLQLLSPADHWGLVMMLAVSPSTNCEGDIALEVQFLDTSNTTR